MYNLLMMYITNKYYYFSNHGKLHYQRRRKRGYSWTQHAEDFINGVAADRLTCRARYQQSPVEVYARFLAIDQVIKYIFYFCN